MAFGGRLLAEEERGQIGSRTDLRQMERDEILEEVDPDASDLVGIQEEELEGCQTSEDAPWKILDLVAIENSVSRREVTS